ELRLSAFPSEVVAAAKLHLLDALGCGLAGHALGIATAGRETMRESGGRTGASVIGGAERCPAPHPAFAHPMVGPGLDFDDTHTDAVCHVSAVMAPAAIAAAEGIGATGADLLVALVAGNETAARIGMAAPAAFHHRGFHPTSVCGVFGATAAAARLRGLGRAAITQALGIAGSFACGIFEYLADGSETKPIHAGVAAQAGSSPQAWRRTGRPGQRRSSKGALGSSPPSPTF